VRLVLDVANLHVNAANRRRAGTTGADADAAALIRALPLERVAYVHAAGGRERDGRLHDTHADPLWPDVDALVEELWARGDIGGDIGGVLLERDGAFPPEAELRAELERLAAAVARGRARRRPVAPEGPPERAFPRRPPDARARLAAAQAALLKSLIGEALPPPGFPPADVGAVAAVLARKRAHAVAHALPDVAATPDFDVRFPAWALRHAQRDTPPRSDAGRYLRALPRRDRTVHACRALVALELDADGGRPLRLRVRRAAGTTVWGCRVGPYRTVRTFGRERARA
jgi:Protein of unknown function (DUF692)